MKSMLLLGICTITWLMWITATLLEKKARDSGKSTSIFPAIPLFPILGWLAGLQINRIKADMGLYVIGGLHIIIASVFLGSMILSAVRIKRKKRTPSSGTA